MTDAYLRRGLVLMLAMAFVLAPSGLFQEMNLGCPSGSPKENTNRDREGSHHRGSRRKTRTPVGSRNEGRGI